MGSEMCIRDSSESDKLKMLEAKLAEVSKQMSGHDKKNLDVYTMADMEDMTRDTKDDEPVKKKPRGRKSKKNGKKKAVSEEEVLEDPSKKCVRCGWRQLKADNKIYSCTICDRYWHHGCGGQGLAMRLESTDTWQCPLCDHTALVSAVKDTLVQLNDLQAVSYTHLTLPTKA